MNLEGMMLREIGQPQKGKSDRFHLEEVPRVVRFIEMKVEWWLQGLRGEKHRKLLFNGCRVLVFQEEKTS